MNILVACESSGIVRDAFIAHGHNAVSLDIKNTERKGPHRQEPLTASVLAEGWDMIIAFPPCTDLSAINAQHWHWKIADGGLIEAYEFVKMIWNSPVPRVAIENPVGWLNTNWRKPTQIINPWNFGDPWKKRTCLWLKGLQPLRKEITEMPDYVDYWVRGQRVANNKYTYGRRNSTDRARTFPGIARAMAEQWGDKHER